VIIPFVLHIQPAMQGSYL